MKNKQKLIPAVAVFAFVAFCFSIANTFGVSYAYTDADCPSGWGFDSTTQMCKKTAMVQNLDDCKEEITSLNSSITGITSGYIVPNDVDYYCQSVNTGGNLYYAYISPTAYKTYSCYQCNSDNTILHWSASTPTGVSCPGAAGWTQKANITSEANCTTRTLTFNPNYGQFTFEGVSYSTTKTVTKAHGTEITLPEATRDGYTFNGWVNGTTNVGKGGTKITLTGNTTLTASWTANGPSGGGTTTEPEEYTVTLNINGGDILLENGSEITKTEYKVEEGKIFELTKYDAEKEKALFMGWATSKNKCTSEEYIAGDLKVTENITFYACYKEEKDFTVTFVLEDDEILYQDDKETSANEFTYGSDETFTTDDFEVEKEGYKFVGWKMNDDKTCSKTIELTADDAENEESIEIYPCWEESKEDEENKDDTTNTDKDNTTNDKENEEIDKNAGTGSTLLYIVFLIGILSLCYTVYYSYKAIKSNK